MPDDREAVGQSICAARGEVAELPVRDLITEIVSGQHAGVRASLDVISRNLTRLLGECGDRYPELGVVEVHFGRLEGELLRHMAKEERVLFPRIFEILDADEGRRPLTCASFGAIDNPIHATVAEHESIGVDVLAIRNVTAGYATPHGASTTYRTVMTDLEQFERDLRGHMRLENAVLFRRALTLEQGLRLAARGTA
jgi:regulator of cell morphogenesis and NO signaling